MDTQISRKWDYLRAGRGRRCCALPCWLPVGAFGVLNCDFRCTNASQTLTASRMHRSRLQVSVSRARQGKPLLQACRPSSPGRKRRTCSKSPTTQRTCATATRGTCRSRAPLIGSCELEAPGAHDGRALTPIPPCCAYPALLAPETPHTHLRPHTHTHTHMHIRTHTGRAALDAGNACSCSPGPQRAADTVGALKLRA